MLNEIKPGRVKNEGSFEFRVYKNDKAEKLRVSRVSIGAPFQKEKNKERRKKGKKQ